MRERSHWSLGIAGASGIGSHDACTARQGEGRCGWMVQRLCTPISASSAMQRGCGCDVPRMTRSCWRSGSVRAMGTVPPSVGSVSDQWKATR